MPQQQRLKWAQLRVGTMVIISLIILALGIFFISGQEGFFRRRYTLKAYISEAGGLRQGAQVSLAGVAAGNVEKIGISPYPERARAVEIVMSVARDYKTKSAPTRGPALRPSDCWAKATWILRAGVLARK